MDHKCNCKDKRILTKKDINITIGLYNYFICPRCRDNRIIGYFNFCSNCGVKLDIDTGE